MLLPLVAALGLVSARHALRDLTPGDDRGGEEGALDGAQRLVCGHKVRQKGELCVEKYKYIVSAMELIELIPIAHLFLAPLAMCG